MKVCSALLAIFGTGCATVLHGTTQTVEITTTPSGATALILPVGKTLSTPGKVRLDRRRAHTVRLSLDGYAVETAYLDRVTSGAIYGNLALGGLIGLSIDASNGAAYQLTPKSLHVTLRPLADDSQAHGAAGALDE